MGNIFRTAAGWRLLAVVTLAALMLCGCAETPPPRIMQPGSFGTVIIDAGHGGKDPGERPHGGLPEKDFALDTAKRLEPLLREAGFHTILTRSTDVFVELDDRVAIANKYAPDALLVSIHYNAAPNSGPRGVETYWWRPDSYGLASRVQRNLISETGMPNHGVIRRVLRLTHNPVVPSILVECGYLTNGTDYALANSPDYRQKAAEGIADGIVEQHEKGDIDIGPLPPVQSYAPVRHTYRHHHVTIHSKSAASSHKKSSSKTKHHKATTQSSSSSSSSSSSPSQN